MLAQVASLIFTGILIWNSAVRPRLLFQPLPAILGHALLYAVLAWFFSALITVGLYFFIPGVDSQRMVWSTLRTAAVAVWFAPACILLSQLSPATLIAALVLVITATRLLYSEWMASRPPGDREPAPELPRPGLFNSDAPRPPVLTRELCTGLAAAVALQSGVISVWRHQPMLAGAWFVLSAAIVTLFAMVSGAVDDARPPNLPRSVMGIAMTVLLASGLTLGGLRAARGRGGDGTPDAGGSGPGAAASAREVLRELFGEEKGAVDKGAGPLPKYPPGASGILPDGSFPGVI